MSPGSFPDQNGQEQIAREDQGDERSAGHRHGLQPDPRVLDDVLGEHGQHRVLGGEPHRGPSPAHDETGEQPAGTGLDRLHDADVRAAPRVAQRRERGARPACSTTPRSSRARTPPTGGSTTCATSPSSSRAARAVATYPGVHYRSPTGTESTSTVLLSVLRAANQPHAESGGGGGLGDHLRERVKPQARPSRPRGPRVRAEEEEGAVLARDGDVDLAVAVEVARRELAPEPLDRVDECGSQVTPAAPRTSLKT